MILVSYKPSFIKEMENLEKDLYGEVLEKIELFQHEKNHVPLKVHKLKGKLSAKYSFSVNYKIRIVFQYESKKEAVLLAIGNHDVYK